MIVYRLSSRLDFSLLTRSKANFFSHKVIVKGTTLKRLPEFSCAFGVRASRFVGNAVRRNLAKRRIRSIFHAANLSGKLHSKIAYLFILRPGCTEAKFDDLLLDSLRGISVVNKLLQKEASGSL